MNCNAESWDSLKNWKSDDQIM